MKKLFFLAATLCGAMAMNATVTGFDARTTSLGTQIHDNGLIQDQNNITLNETDKTAHKYEIKITTGGECSFTMGGITFWYSNTNDGTVAYKTFGTYIQPNGNKRKVTIPVVAGKNIQIGVQDEITVALEGASVSSITLDAWGDDKDILTTITPASGSKEIVMWSDDRSESFTPAKFKLGAIIYSDPTDLKDAAAASGQVKKIVKDGKMFILKDGKEISVLGF